MAVCNCLLGNLLCFLVYEKNKSKIFTKTCLNLSRIPAIPLFSFELIKIAGKILRGVITMAPFLLFKFLPF